MSKAILVLEMPHGCDMCRISSIAYDSELFEDGECFCTERMKSVDRIPEGKRPHWCPLRPLSEHMEGGQETRKAPRWIYAPLSQNKELEDVLEKIENVLGFKLFIWQKTFIERGTFRRYGDTTARILRDLLQVDEPPMDYTMHPSNKMERFYRCELLEIKERLDKAGIHTRKVATSRQQLKKYIKEYECGKIIRNL